jgi:hypothetical protein
MTGCGGPAVDARRLDPVYDKKTGKLELLKYDSKGDGYFDTFSYMDGNRIVRIEIDSNRDGAIDRWEYYGEDGKLTRIGISRGGDGVADVWSYPRADGSIERTEISTRHDGKITRTEYFEGKALVRAEEDTDEDGRIDKWETYEGDRLSVVSFDTLHRGVPDRRMVYGPDGTARMQVDPAGDGRFRSAP